MSAETTYVDASGDPVLSRLVQEVRDTNQARIIRLGNEDVAIIAPIRRRPKGRTLSEADRQAFLDSLGGWKDVDTDRLLDDIYAARRVSDRPPVEL
ncbi:MAG TPA: hypothetical protein VII06_15200 [Chloroflexota bacterium]|jgi:hypothetical protein